jgi:deoxyribonuclease-4
MSFRYGGSTFNFIWVEDAVTTMRRLRAIGYRDFDIFLTPPSFWPIDMSAGDRSRMMSQLKAEDIRIESINFPNYDYNPAAPTQVMRDFSYKMLADQIPICSELGIPRFIVIPGRYGISSPAREVGIGWLRACFDKLLPLAERYNVQLVIENVPSTVLPSMGQIVDFVSSYDHPSLAICYDVANAEFAGDDHIEQITRAAKWLVQVHISDATRTRWAHDPIGMGSIDFRSVGTCLQSIGFSSVAINEVRGEPRVDSIRLSQERLIADYGWPAADVAHYCLT